MPEAIEEAYSALRERFIENPPTCFGHCAEVATPSALSEFEVRLHPLPSMTLAQGLCCEADIRRLFEFWRGFMAEAPIDLKWNIDLRLAPNDKQVTADIRGRPLASSSLDC